ncbi:Dopey, N-terminal-domain-containing protein [Lipomyces tetrasporus]|uniref:Dopey, N-terminal-domain-containing protein n=1 Tax=Lipomyces tetrasporus TaxID=54092 RepID=A0AAD7VW29_9ASCO|nr:Dopey, N-terminal-domain-containing protein [Lipomyces tetrasporus]KAJ8104168.1 Dopey, N-terminal-domain-containing protein [Lipomyces tetrasporus]
MAPTPPSTSSILQTISPLPFILSKSDDSVRKKDPKYKRYAANIDKALALFERVEEWADYISFLGKLLRALQSHTAQQIPYSPIIANRLAQSLHPNLPSGVHQKALELYGYIFGVLGRDELSRELHIWIPGLLPLMSYASINVKPHLLHIMESYILPIPAESLRPIVRPLLLALLPGIDDETSESFTDTLNLIDRFRVHVADDQYFWQCFFLVILSSDDRRLGAIIYATRKFPSLSVITNDKTKDALLESLSDELKAIVTPEPGLMVRALGKGLEDEQMLVQRGFLELLVRNLQLQSGILQNLVTSYDLTQLIISASSVVLRRDMSLNRRLWTWLLGPEPSVDQSQSTPTLSRSEYFRKFGLTFLVNGLNELISSVSPDPISRARPYRICLSLMDRWEVGSLVVPEVLIPIVRSVRRYKEEARSDAHYQEVLKSASAFFDGVEASNIWSDGFKLIATEHDLDLLLFIVRTFNVREEEMVIVHLPLILVTLFILRKQVPSINRKIWLELASEILEAIPARALLPTAQSQMQSLNGAETLERISQFYKRSPDDPSTPPYLPATISWILLTATAELVTATVNDLDPDAGDVCIFAVNLLAKIPGETTWRNDSLVQALLGLTPTLYVPFKVLYGATRLLGVVIERNGMTRQEIDLSIRSFTELHWHYLSIPTGKFHVESVTSLWDLQSKCKDHRIEAAISNLVAEAYEKPEAGHAFINLWAHSVDYANFEAILTRPLLLMLDSLEDKYSPLRSISLAWLEMLGATSTSNRLYGILVSRILKLPFLRRQEYSFGEDDDLELFLYYLKTLTNILSMGPPSLCASLGTDMISVDASRSNLLQHMGLEEGDPSYRGFFIRVIIRTLKYDIPPDSSPELHESLSKVLRGALQLLNVILMNPDKPATPELAVEQALTSRLSSNLHMNDIYTQTLILDVLFRTLKVNYGDGTSENANIHQDSVIKLRDSVEVHSSIDGASSRAPTSSLIQCVIDGISTDENQPVLDSWVKFLVDCLPFFSDVLFQILIPVVECFCSQVKKTFEELKVVYSSTASTSHPGSEGALFALMHGLEHIMVAAHDKLLDEESKTANPKAPAEPGFFGTVISGVFSVESPQARSAAANNRLTVLLCFQDCIKICHAIWLWGEEIAKGAQNDPDSASNESFMYISSRMKYRARRILERLYMTETLESLETLIDLHRITPVFKLLHVLDGSRPKLTLPYILNAIYSRINPVILESSAKSSLTTDLADYQLLEFLVDYVHSLENDAIEEVWMDCMAFVKDAQANVGLYRHVLPSLLVFISTIGSKVDLTNFGEQRRLRKELADMFLKLLNSAVTARQISGVATPEPSALPSSEKDKYSDSEGTRTPTSVTNSAATTIAQSPQPPALQTQLSFQQLSLSSSSTMPLTPVEKPEAPSSKPKFSQDDLCRALAQVVPNLQKVLLESDRVLAACTTLGASIISPALKSKNFPSSANAAVLEVLYQVTKIPSTEKAWKTSVTDAYYDGKFFTVGEILRPKWSDILRQWLKNDKERMPDLIARVSSHSSNTNALFGWSDQESIMRRLNLRRVAFAYMCGDKDQFIMNLKETLDKLSELVSSSVRESIRSDVFLCLRAIILRTSPVHLPPFWTFIYTELQDVFSELTNSDPSNLRPENLQGVFAACKLLDTILVLGSEEFQLHHWLFIKDTLEAVFPNAEASPLPLVDRLSLLLGVPMSTAMTVNTLNVSLTESAMRRPMLIGQKLNTIVELKTFFSRLSIANFERVYTLGVADINLLEDEVYGDLFA